MTQTVAAIGDLGSANTGLTIGVTVLNVDRTSYAAFSTTGVSESTDVAGLYYKSGGVVVPDAGGFIQWGTAATVYAEDTVLPKPATQASVDVIDNNVDLILVDTGTTLDAKLNTIDNIVDDILQDTSTTLPAQISGLNNLSAAQVNAEVDAALADYDAPTKAELDAGLAALNDPTAAAIADAILDEPLSGHTTAGTLGKAVADIEVDTSTSIPSTLSTLATQAQVNGLNDLASADVAAAVWSALKTSHTTASTFGKILQDLETTIATVASNVSSVLTDTDTTIPGLINGLNDPTAAAIADAVWDEALAGHATAGSAGAKLTAAEADTDSIKTTVDTNLDATVSSRSTFDYTAEQVTVGTNNDKSNYVLAATQTGVTIPTVTNVTNPVTAGTVSDKTGYSIAGSLTTLDDLNDISAADVNAQVLDVLATDTFAELASIPGATSTLVQKITFLFMVARNQLEQNASTQTLRADNSTTAVGTASVSDNGTTFIRAKYT